MKAIVMLVGFALGAVVPGFALRCYIVLRQLQVIYQQEVESCEARW
jgi:hypothetical protein